VTIKKVLKVPEEKAVSLPLPWDATTASEAAR
jgi:hypothetical protein